MLAVLLAEHDEDIARAPWPWHPCAVGVVTFVRADEDALSEGMLEGPGRRE
jgi:hypothetical protein